jgi:phosphoribosyl 1,2-cyclic phosphodiesterase
MSLELCILASGSCGNAALLRTPSGILLIDAGLGPISTSRRLDGTGVHLRDISAICLTHLDHDHFAPTWLRTLIKNQTRIFCSTARVPQLLRRVDHHPLAPQFAKLIEPFTTDPFDPLPNLRLHPIPLAHDHTGSHGFVIEGHGCRVGYATDLGRVPPALLQHFTNLDILALESNYDPQMQIQSSRPDFLKSRIMNGSGHLSNQQAFDAIQRILNRAQQSGRLPEHIVLLHRSLECNCPHLLRRLFCRDLRIQKRLTLADQFHRTTWLRPSSIRSRIGPQLTLAFA